MITATVDDLLEWGPCWGPESVHEFVKGKSEWSLQEVLDLREELSPNDWVWLTCHFMFHVGRGRQFLAWLMQVDTLWDSEDYGDQAALQICRGLLSGSSDMDALLDVRKGLDLSAEVSDLVEAFVECEFDQVSHAAGYAFQVWNCDYHGNPTDQLDRLAELALEAVPSA